MSNLFIPKKIKVGYQNRTGTYTGKLAYVVYIDNKGVLRKEKSWESWRDKKIQAEEFENTPQDGFCLNKDVQRVNWSHFGTGRSYIRMYDPRGIEFEITPENLTNILTETDSLKRGFQGQFVYAWKGAELILLPCVSEEYQQALKHTERQDQNIKAKDLKEGISYTTKTGEEVIYLGRFNYWKRCQYSSKPNTVSKQYIFADGDNFIGKKDLKFLALQNNEEVVSNYAELIDKWNCRWESTELDHCEIKPFKPSLEEALKISEKGFLLTQEGDNLYFWRLYTDNRIDSSYYLNTKTLKYTYSYGYSPVPLKRFNYGYSRQHTPEEIQKALDHCVKATAHFKNGKSKEIDSYSI